MKFLLSVLLFLPAVAVATAPQPSVLKGDILDPEIDPAKPIFFFQRSIEKDGARQVSYARYTDKDGKPAVDEVTEYENGKLKKYTYKQYQVQEEGTINIDNDRVRYSFNKQGKLKEDADTLEENSIVSDMVAPFVRSHWDELMRGDTLKVRYLLVERLESIGFKFFKDKERKLDGKELVDITMKPSSIFIAAVAPKITLSFEKNPPHRMLESFGRLPVRVPEVPVPKTRKDWRAIDAYMKLRYEEKP